MQLDAKTPQFFSLCPVVLVPCYRADAACKILSLAWVFVSFPSLDLIKKYEVRNHTAKEKRGDLVVNKEVSTNIWVSMRAYGWMVQIMKWRPGM